MHTQSEQLYICPRCGDIIFESLCHVECLCGLAKEKVIKINYTSDIYNQMTEDDRKQWEEMLRKRYVLCPDNPYYDKEAYYEREDEDFEVDIQFKNSNTKSSINQSTQTVCPKCGSTSFTPVRRKWSFLTGFMTNKVDMVCNNCGCTVKRG